MKVKMRKTAAGPDHTPYLAGKTYDVDARTAKRFSDADACELLDAVPSGKAKVEHAVSRGGETTAGGPQADK